MECLPRGQALYTIVLKGCERTEDGIRKVPPELLCTGDFSPGRWMWEWGEPEPFHPFPIKGGQGWWFCDVPDGAFRCAMIQNAPAQQAEASPQPSEARGRTDASLTPGTNQSNLKEERS